MARDVMRAEGLDALLVYGEHEDVPAAPFSPDNYFSNDRPGTIVMFFGDEDPVQLVRSPMHVEDHIEATRRGDELWIEPRNIRVGKDPAHVAALIDEHGVAAGTIGVVGLEPYPPWHILPILPHALYAPLVAQFPKATFTPVWFPLLRRMLPNSAEELALVRYAARVGDEIASAMLGAARPGATDADVLAAGMAAGYVGGAQPHIIINTGKNPVSWGDAPWAYRPQRPQVIAEGDVIMSEVLNAVARKETQSQVAIAVGHVAPEIEQAAKVARACWGLRTFPPAQAYGELGVVPTIGGELPLAPGMTFAFEPSCVIDGHMVNLGGTVVVGDDDPIELNPSTARLMRS